MLGRIAQPYANMSLWRDLHYKIAFRSLYTGDRSDLSVSSVKAPCQYAKDMAQ